MSIYEKKIKEEIEKEKKRLDEISNPHERFFNEKMFRSIQLRAYHLWFNDDHEKSDKFYWEKAKKQIAEEEVKKRRASDET
jgi:hypothetical protein